MGRVPRLGGKSLARWQFSGLGAQFVPHRLLRRGPLVPEAKSESRFSSRYAISNNMKPAKKAIGRRSFLRQTSSAVGVAVAAPIMISSSALAEWDAPPEASSTMNQENFCFAHLHDSLRTKGQFVVIQYFHLRHSSLHKPASEPVNSSL
jgi:hypothetical protein